MIQFLHKKKDKFNAKLRKRKFKSRVYNKQGVRNASYNRTISPFPWLVSLKVKHACRLKFKTFIGTEKSLMVTKNKVWIHYDKYPNFFVTKKSSKSRMGKGKGKIAGRILKIHKGETIFNIHLANFFKTKRWLKAVKGTLPSTTTLISHSWGARRFYFNHYSTRIRYRRKFRRKKKKKPFWVKTAVLRYRLFDGIKKMYKSIFYFRRLCRFYLGSVPKDFKKVKFHNFVNRFTNRIFQRRYHFNSFSVVNRSRRKKLWKYKARPRSRKIGHFRRLRILSTARRRSYFNRDETMFYVLESLNLNVRAPDVDGFVGMARYLNFISSRRQKIRLLRAASGRPQL